MRWWDPVPGNPWPPDMAITVEERPPTLTTLLYVRHAWSIVPGADIPDLTPAPDPGASQMPDTATAEEWETRWREAWYMAWDLYHLADPERQKHSSRKTLPQDTKRDHPLNPAVPFRWTNESFMAGMDHEAFNAWSARLAPIPPPDIERHSLADLIPAWESGLDTILVLPYAGYFAKRFTSRHLAVSAETRNDPDSYGRALRSRL